MVNGSDIISKQFWTKVLKRSGFINLGLKDEVNGFSHTLGFSPELLTYMRLL
jgi:hypothetical protein